MAPRGTRGIIHDLAAGVCCGLMGDKAKAAGGCAMGKPTWVPWPPNALPCFQGTLLQICLLPGTGETEDLGNGFRLGCSFLNCKDRKTATSLRPAWLCTVSS